MLALATSTASFRRWAKRCAVASVSAFHAFIRCAKIASVAIWLASSPAAAPPMPSATTNKDPRSPRLCWRTWGWSDASWRVRSATRNRSSLCSRDRPTSVLPNTCTRMGLAERPNMALRPTGRLLEGIVRARRRLPLHRIPRPLARLGLVGKLGEPGGHEIRGHRLVLVCHARRVVDVECRVAQCPAAQVVDLVEQDVE